MQKRYSNCKATKFLGPEQAAVAVAIDTDKLLSVILPITDEPDAVMPITLLVPAAIRTNPEPEAPPQSAVTMATHAS